jgi:hypothetical protein
MTSAKWIIVIAITAAAIWAGATLANWLNQPDVYTGTDVKFTASPSVYMVIDSQNVNLAAASSKFFALYKTTGETVIPTPQKPPLSWTEDAYLATSPVSVPGGKWNVAVGRPIVEITSDSPVTVHVVQTDDAVQSNQVLAGLLGFIAWMVVFSVLAAFQFFND